MDAPDEKAGEGADLTADADDTPLELDTAAAEEALEAFREKAAEPISIELDAAGSLGEGNDQSGKLNMDLTEARANLESFRKDASKPVSMSGNASGIFDHLPPGIGTYGDTEVTVKDEDGGEHAIRFSKADTLLMYTLFYVTKLPGADEEVIKNTVSPRVVEYINAMPCGATIPLTRLIGVAYAANPEIAGTYVITSVAASVDGSGWIRDVVECPWNKCLFAGSMTGWMTSFIFS